MTAQAATTAYNIKATCNFIDGYKSQKYIQWIRYLGLVPNEMHL